MVTDGDREFPRPFETERDRERERDFERLSLASIGECERDLLRALPFPLLADLERDRERDRERDLEDPRERERVRERRVRDRERLRDLNEKRKTMFSKSSNCDLT